jgi:hypothetical protein
MNGVAVRFWGIVSVFEAAQGEERPHNSRIVLGLLNSVERDGGRSQRRLGSELGIGSALSTPTSSAV